MTTPFTLANMRAMDFALHPTLKADTHFVADLPLSRLLLMNDTHYPWLILVPRRFVGQSSDQVDPRMQPPPSSTSSAPTYVRDVTDLAAADQVQLWHEVTAVEKALKHVTGAVAPHGKMNVAALSNVVQQLHVHVIARFDTDAAWPAPVWGKLPAVPYQPSQAGALIAKLKVQLASRYPDYI